MHDANDEVRVFDRRGYVLLYDRGKVNQKQPALQAMVSRDGIHSPDETPGKPFRGNPAIAFRAVRSGREGWPFREVWVDKEGGYLFHEKAGVVRTLRSIPVKGARLVSLHPTNRLSSTTSTTTAFH